MGWNRNVPGARRLEGRRNCRPSRRGRRRPSRIYDIKTGSIDYPHKMAMQLAMYARSLPTISPPTPAVHPPTSTSTPASSSTSPPAKAAATSTRLISRKAGAHAYSRKKVWHWRDTKDLLHKVGDERRDLAEIQQSRAHPFRLVATGWSRTESRRIALRVDACKKAGHLTPEFRAIYEECRRAMEEKSNSQEPVLVGEAAWIERVGLATTLDQLHLIWTAASHNGYLTEDFRALCTERPRAKH